LGASEWQEEGHAAEYLERADSIPHRGEGEAALLEELPAGLERVLDLGAGDGRLLALVLACRPEAVGVAVDFLPAMLAAARARFAGERRVRVVEHDLAAPLPDLGTFDAVVSSFAIHHLEDERKRALFAEVRARLSAGGAFLNLEHVASPTPRLHARFLEAMGITPAEEDPSNRLLDVETQLRWLRELGFADADCLWKWRELALLAAWRPG
jgi:SAM-dependent methyltransferase